MNKAAVITLETSKAVTRLYSREHESCTREICIGSRSYLRMRRMNCHKMLYFVGYLNT